MMFTPTPRTLVFSGLISALLSVIIVHFGKSHLENILISLNEHDIKLETNYSNKESLLQTVEEPVEVNKLIDAIFVSHGTEETSVKRETSNESLKSEEKLESTSVAEEEQVQEVQVSLQEIVVLDKTNFRNIYEGDWLILANVPWMKTGMKFQENFKSAFPEVLSRHSNIKLATLNCHEEPLLAAILQVRQYHSLLLVTDSGRLREWPFASSHMNTETFRFLVHREWKHIPVYQRLSTGPIHQFALKSIQIHIFNKVYGFLIQTEEKMFNWIREHRNLARGLVLSSLGALILFSR